MLNVQPAGAILIALSTFCCIILDMRNTHNSHSVLKVYQSVDSVELLGD